MKKRDREILQSLEKFRVLERDQLIKLHFRDVNQPITVCNRVMNRLKLRGEVVVNDKVRPFEYMRKPAPFSFRSNKRLHFGEIADTFIQATEVGNIRDFEIEIKLGKKGTVEPDIYMNFNRVPMFVEVQRSKQWTKTFMEKKLDRYEEYFYSDAWKEERWQTSEKKVFPIILIVSPHEYTIKDRPFSILQAKDMYDFAKKYVKKKKA
jgi:hypothetical protein